MEQVLTLGATEIVGERPFTHPDRTADDLVWVQAMLAALRRVLAASGALPARPRPLGLQVPEASGRQHRLVVCDERRLRLRQELALVGFFAERRPGLDHAPLAAADEELILEFPRHPGVLSYSSLELPGGEWGNVILLDAPDTQERWREGERHAYAARELAPRHYACVRLHNARLPAGLLASGDPVLTRTKYHDFRATPPWRAERVPGPT